MAPPLFSIRSILSVIAIAAAFLAASYLAAPHDKQEEAQQLARELALQTKLTSNLVPWPSRAELKTKGLLSANLDKVAAASLLILHPSGRDPELMYVVRRQEDRILVQLDLTWHGGVLNREYLSVLIWEFDSEKHVGAKLLADSSGAQPDALAREQLDDYFRTMLYSEVRRRVAEAEPRM